VSIEHPAHADAGAASTEPSSGSRNRLVVRALEQAVSVRTDWSPEFLQRLRTVDRETSTAVDDLLAAVTKARRSKEPRDL
jgi:hypothetical protein